jgi:uncharacterized protein YegP (UPF0339 family)
MATKSGENALISWYRTRVGHPTNRNEVYGYWTFVLGAVLALLGAGWIIVRAGAGRGSREFGFVLVMVAAVLLLAGGTLRLPLSEFGTRLTQVGGVVAVIAVAAFSAVFPENWSYGAGEIPLIGIGYVGGLAIMTAAPVIAPIVSEGPTAEELADQLSVLAAQHEELTVEKRAAVSEAQQADEQRAELASEVERLQTELAETEEKLAAATTETESARAAHADAEERATAAEQRLARIEDSQATFEVYKDRASEWRWRLVHQNRNIIATSGEGYSSDRTARRGFRSVKRNAPGADVIWLPTEEEPEPEPEPVKTEAESDATAELFTDDGDRHRWRLRHRNGNVLAIAARGYAARSNARDGLESAQRVVGPAEYLTFDPAGFEVYQDAAGEYRWRLVARNGEIIADSGEGYATRSNARTAVETVQTTASEASVDSDGDRPAFELFEDSAGEYRWRFLAANGEEIADSGEGYTERNDAVEAAERVREYAPDASTVTVGDAAVELFEDEGGDHRWRLRHRNGRLLAIAADGFGSRSDAIGNLNSVKRNLPNAPSEELSD